jgi:hypothetical protein
MKLRELKAIIRESVRKTLAENQPAPAPAKPERGTEVHPGKPGEKQKPRRTFEPKPGAEPKPKALSETEQQIVDKIVQRMRSKKEMNESVYLDPKSNKELSLQKVGNKWEIDIRKKDDMSFSRPVTIKRDTLEQIKDWCKQYNLPTDWIKETE